MAQPPAYSPATDFSNDESVNIGGRSTVRTDRLDAELDALELTIAAIRTNLSLLQRDDGKLRDALVQYYNLSASCKAAVLATKWNAMGLWETATVYAVSDMVDKDGAAYICAEAHTAGTFATDYTAGKWQIFTAASTAGGTAFTPTTTVESTNVQDAINEVDTENRAAAMPNFAATYGAL
jgi:hypothetical protein